MLFNFCFSIELVIGFICCCFAVWFLQAIFLCSGQSNGAQILRLDDPLAQSRWERSVDGEGTKPKVETVVTSKWQKVEEIKEVEEDSSKKFPDIESLDQ